MTSSGIFKDEESHLKLSEPFDPKWVEYKIGTKSGDKKSGKPFAFVDSRHIMNRLDQVVGQMNWQAGVEITGEKTQVGIAIRRSDGEWVWKWDMGSYEAKTESNAERISTLGASTVGFRRAAILWDIGRYLMFLKKFKYYPINKHGYFESVPDLEVPEYWWALPYDHSIAQAHWINKYGSIMKGILEERAKGASGNAEN